MRYKIEGQTLLEMGVESPDMMGLVCFIDQDFTEWATWIREGRTHTQIKGVGPQSYGMHKFLFYVDIAKSLHSKQKDDPKFKEASQLLDRLVERQQQIDALNTVTTVKEIADLYRITPQAVIDTIKTDKLPARKSGGTWLILKSDAESRWNKKCRSKI